MFPRLGFHFYYPASTDILGKLVMTARLEEKIRDMDERISDRASVRTCNEVSDRLSENGVAIAICLTKNLVQLPVLVDCLILGSTSKTLSSPAC